MYSPTQQRELFELSKKLIDKKTEETQSPAEIVTDLHKVIVYHEWRYYVLNEPVLSDFEYDVLFKYLENLEHTHPELIIPTSPTQRVSNDLTDDFPAVEHLTPMLSLENSYNIEDLKDFDRRVKEYAKTEADIEYCVEPKFDGGTIALVYEDGLLTRAATRGNGVKGEDMTANAKAMRSIPMQADFGKSNMHKVELRGEVIIRKDVFEKVNKKREKNGDSILANPRNAATGAMRVKKPKEVGERGLEAFIYQLGYALDKEGNNVLQSVETHDNSIALLGNLGFKIPQLDVERKICKNIEEVHDFCRKWEAQREQYNYEIDGMVIKVNSTALQEKCGYTGHHPRWAIAFKFKAKQATTKLLNIEYQVGKIGAITPVAKLEPVQLAGVTISSVSLHNEEFIKSKNIKIGDTVLVERAGDVIPYIVKSMEDLRDGSEQEVVFPTECPSCQSKLVKPETEAVWRCENITCPAQNSKKIVAHVSKDAMNIDGFGKSNVERFVAEGWLKNIADVYRLDYDKVKELEGFGKRSATKLEAAINEAKKNPIHRLLYSLSVHHLGRKVSKILAAEINHVLDLSNWKEENFTNIHDVGKTVATNVMAYFADPKNIALLKEMEALGVNLKQTEEDKPKAIVEDGAFSGKTILFTGTLTQMKRKEAQEKAVAAGAKLVSSVSKNLNILVAGEKAGSKLKKANALGTVTVMTEDEFVKAINL